MRKTICVQKMRSERQLLLPKTSYFKEAITDKYGMYTGTNNKYIKP